MLHLKNRLLVLETHTTVSREFFFDVHYIFVLIGKITSAETDIKLKQWADILYDNHQSFTISFSWSFLPFLTITSNADTTFLKTTSNPSQR